MDFLSLVKQRQSVRKYQDKDIPHRVIDKCLEAARLAPSASNSQPWKWIIVDQPDVLAPVAKACNDMKAINKFVAGAKAIAVIVLEKPKLITRIATTIKKREWSLIDVGIAAEHFCLQATELGLGTCMIGWYNEKKIQEVLEIPKNKSIALLIAMGYPPEDYENRVKIRKSLDEIKSNNKY
ncbi:MAG: nitroreductase family protein [Bacteroidales bacterium]